MSERPLLTGGLPRWAIDRVLLCPLLQDESPPHSETLLCGECGVVLLRTPNPERDTAGALLVCTICGALNVDITTTGEVPSLRVPRRHAERPALREVSAPASPSPPIDQPVPSEDVPPRSPVARSGVILPFHRPASPARNPRTANGAGAGMSRTSAGSEDGPTRPA
jgi:hypothetical protein